MKHHPHIGIELERRVVTCRIVCSETFTLTNHHDASEMHVHARGYVGDDAKVTSWGGVVDSFPFASADEAYAYTLAYWQNEPKKPAGVPDIGKGAEQVGLFS